MKKIFTTYLAAAAMVPLGVAGGSYMISTERAEAAVIVTLCAVQLASGAQIAVPAANSLTNCQTAGPKCAAGRPYTNIYFNTNPFGVEANGVNEICNYAF